ncbi:hypothetical protein SLEP1_g50999 [Rubroshorea leprosula]|uniref:Uncharacterized protein n=1 Tax=Rubroshorea leprosula TaxID=152421 RepID=A0AAV5M526_9ROSI|nr:hypothetical protein SLEP1_g50999 [Rubroshorea leprosula]
MHPLICFFLGLLGDDDDDGGDGDNGYGKQRDLWFCPFPSISMVIEDGDGGGGCDDDEEMQGDGLDLQKREESREKKRWVLGELDLGSPEPRFSLRTQTWVLQESPVWVLGEPKSRIRMEVRRKMDLVRTEMVRSVHASLFNTKLFEAGYKDLWMRQGKRPTEVAASKYQSIKDGRLERGSEKIQG